MNFDDTYLFAVAFEILFILILNNLNFFEAFFVKLSFSWTFSKFAPYLVFFILSFFGFRQIIKIISPKPLPKITLGVFIFLIPILSYFFLFPIYTGDLVNVGKKVKTNFEFSNKKKLVIIVLPDCPYCHESMIISKKLIERNPKLEIEYWVTGDVTDSKIEKLKSNRISIIKNPEIDKTIYLTEGVFPTYALTNNKKLEKRWTNNEFGVLALDEIEQFFR